MRIPEEKYKEVCDALIEISQLDVEKCFPIIYKVASTLNSHQKNRSIEAKKLKNKETHGKWIEKMSSDSGWDLSEVTKKYIDLLKGEYEIHKPIKPFSEIPKKSKRTIDKKSLYVEFDKYVLYRHCPHPVYEGIRYHGSMNYWEVGEPVNFPQRPNRHYLEAVNKFWCPKCESIYDESDKAGGKLLCRPCSRRHERLYLEKNPDKRIKQDKRRFANKSSRPYFNAHQKINKRVKGFLSGDTKKPGFDIYWQIIGIKPAELKKYLIHNYDTKIYNLDHIIPVSLLTEIYKRDMRGSKYLNELFAAVWHYSNLQIICKKHNQTVKQDKIDGKRPYQMENKDLLAIADKLIEDTEALRNNSEFQVPHDIFSF